MNTEIGVRVPKNAEVELSKEQEKLNELQAMEARLVVKEKLRKLVHVTPMIAQVVLKSKDIKIKDYVMAFL